MSVRRVVRHLAAAALLLLAGAAGAADAPSKILERAIAFHGGRAALEALPAVEARGMYESAGRMAGSSWPIVDYEKGDGAYRQEVTFERRGRKVTVVEIYDGKICKRKFGSSWDDLPLDEPRERAAHRVSFLAAAASKDAKALGEGTEADVDVDRLSVPDGRGLATLSFARDDGRLVAMEFPGIEAEGMGTKKEVTRKIIFRDWRKVGSVVLAHDVELLKDGSAAGRLRYEKIVPIATWDDGWLKVPDPRRRFIPGEELAN